MTAGFAPIAPALYAHIASLAHRLTLLPGAQALGTTPVFRRGDSTLFDAHKIYQPGDDLRRIDWRASARGRSPHVKTFVQESNHSLLFLLDISGSMGFVERGIESKLAYAKTLIYALSHVVLSRGDAVGLVCGEKSRTIRLPVRSGGTQLRALVQSLEQTDAGGETHLAGLFAASEPDRALRAKKTVVVLSDFFDPAWAAESAVKRLALGGQLLVFVQLFDPAERDLTTLAPAHFASMETKQSHFVRPTEIRDAFAKTMTMHARRYQAAVASIKGRFIPASTARPHEQVVHDWIASPKP